MASRALSLSAAVVTFLAIGFSVLAVAALTRWAVDYRSMITEARTINEREAAKPPDFDSRLVIQDVRSLKAAAVLANASTAWLATKGGLTLLALFLALFTWVAALQLQILLLPRKRGREEQLPLPLDH